MADHFLLRSQQNEVLNAIQAGGLDPREFTWRAADTEASWTWEMPSQMRVPVLVHTPTEFRSKFDFDTSQGRHAGYFEPGKQTPSERIEDAEWPELLAVVSAWVEYVRREYEAPDLWRDLQLERQVVSGMAPAENTPFAPSEQAQIIEQLRELREFVRSSYQLSTSQLTAIEKRLDYLAEAATRLGRLDWRNLMVGALLGLIVEAVVPPEPIRAILGLIVRGLGHLFGGGAPPELPLA